MGWGAFAGGALGTLGAVYSAKSAASGQAKANRMNIMMGLNQQRFQERMARHAHRYEVQDLRKAGLNPILSATGGSGSATPSGSAPHVENEKGSGISSALDALATITESFLKQQQINQTNAQTQLTQATTENTQARTATEKTQPDINRATVGFIHQQASTSKATEQNIMLDNALKDVGYKVQLSEIDKNQELTRLFHKQGLTQDATQALLGMNLQQATEELNRKVLDGAVTRDGYNVFRTIVSEPLKIMYETDWKGDASFHYDRLKKDFSDFNERMKAKARAPH